MPNLELSTLVWIGCLSTAAVVWLVLVSPRLIPKLRQGFHQSDTADARRLSVVDRVTLYMASLLMFVVVFIVMVMFVEVVLRYVFASPTLWAEELSRWLGGVFFLLSGVYAMQQRSHIRVVLFYDLVSRRLQHMFDLVCVVCVVFFCYAVTVGYAKNAWTKFETWELYGSAWNPPIPAIMKPLVVISCVWIAIQALNNLVMDWSTSRQVGDRADSDLVNNNLQD